MKRTSIMSLVAGLVLALAQSAWADDGLDVTLQVLDDVSSVDGVVLSVDDGVDDTDRQTDERDHDSAADADEHANADGEHDGLDADASDDDVAGSDFEEHRDGHVEDSDVPHTPEVDEVPADGEPHTDPATTDGAI